MKTDLDNHYDEHDYEFDYSRVVSDSEDFHYDDASFDYDDVERAEMQEWEQWHDRIANELN